MDLQDKEFFERLMQLTEENNKILRRMQKVARGMIIWRIVYWSLIIAITVGSFYYIQPYVDSLMSVYGNIQGSNDAFQNFVNPFDQ